MAIYRLHVKVISRKTGQSAVASAAYRSASRLRDERLERAQDFPAKRGVVHSEVLLPEHARERWSDRERLWNDVEAFEVRKDAQLACDFAQSEFVGLGMIADLNGHWDVGEDGMPKPHAHVMLTMRAVDANGFGPKVRDWNRTEMVERWRERWAELAKERMAELDIDARIDHRSFEAQGIVLEPQSQIGAPAQHIEAEGIEADRAEMHREIARGNGERIIVDPSLALDAVTQQQSTFTRRDMARFAHRHSDGLDQFNGVMGAMRNAPDLVELGQADPAQTYAERRGITFRAVDAVFSADDTGNKPSREQLREVSESRKAFEAVRPYGWRDAEAAYEKNSDLAREAGSGRVIRAVRALQLETEIRNSPDLCADRFAKSSALVAALVSICDLLMRREMRWDRFIHK